MKRNRIIAGFLVVLMLALSIVVIAQVARPYRNGSVWTIGFIRMKPGMDAAYKDYLATDWKKQQEALKKDGLIISYKVMTTEAHGTGDFNVMLLTEYKDLATMEANQSKVDSVNQKVVGDDTKQMQGYKDRLEIREVLQNRIAREIVLESK
jgi:hypothetical protein